MSPDTIDVNESIFQVSATPAGITIQCRPYLSSRTLNCKERWRGKTLTEIFSTEFRLHECDIINKCMHGDILLNDTPCGCDSIVKNGDIIFHQWLCHEPAVEIPNTTALRVISYAAMDASIIAVFKPHGLPTTPQGIYYTTNLTTILRSSKLFSKIFPESTYLQPLNRLDKAVAGIVLFSLDPKVTAENVVLRKLYIAKVSRLMSLGDQEMITCAAKLLVQKHIPNQVLHTVIDEENGKESVTHFYPNQEYPEYVLCEPVTGRTHQIRAHLGYLGCPLVGDHNYADGGHLDSQPEAICLMAFRYSVRINGGTLSITVPSTCIPDWLPRTAYDIYNSSEYS